LFKEILPSELEAVKAYVGESAFNSATMKRAIEIFDELVQQGDYKEFLDPCRLMRKLINK
jgi:hypothetical protein